MEGNGVRFELQLFIVVLGPPKWFGSYLESLSFKRLRELLEEIIVLNWAVWNFFNERVKVPQQVSREV
jgi:hypothetical protein